MALAPSLWGPQRIANTITAGAQVTPSIAGLTYCYFALGWLSVEPIMVTDFGPYLRLQAFDQFGNMSGANQVADTADPLFSGDGLQGPDLAAGLSGTFSVPGLIISASPIPPFKTPSGQRISPPAWWRSVRRRWSAQGVTFTATRRRRWGRRGGPSSISSIRIRAAAMCSSRFTPTPR